MKEIFFALNPWWEGRSFEVGVSRLRYLTLLEGFLKRRQIEIIIGGRRTGKTTILKQLIKNQTNGIAANKILYLALDHPQLIDKTLTELLRTFRSFFSHSRDEQLLLFFDEVQESPNWQSELKSIYDLEKVKIVASGSTSSLLKNQGGKLTGRQITTQVFPLSFDEFLFFKKAKISLAETYRYESLAEEYLQIGGYPENVLLPSQEYLYNLLEDIIARDLIRLFAIRKASLLKDLFKLVTASVGSRVSFTKLARILGISVDTAKEYVSYFADAFLVDLLGKWTPSYTEKVYATKKIYLLDTGLKTLVTGKGDLGAKAENAVFLHLASKKETMGYFADTQKEVDFVLGSLTAPLPIEVKYDTRFDWQDRRFAGLKLFLKRYPGTNKAIIVTKSVETSLREKETLIEVKPLWKFLLK